MVFRCEATWKERDAITRRFRRHANLSRFRDAASRDARRGPRIVMRARRKRAAAARGSAAASEPKIPEASARKAKRAKREPRGAISVAAVNRLFTQVRQHMSWLGCGKILSQDHSPPAGGPTVLPTSQNKRHGDLWSTHTNHNILYTAFRTHR